MFTQFSLIVVWVSPIAPSLMIFETEKEARDYAADMVRHDTGARQISLKRLNIYPAIEQVVADIKDEIIYAAGE